MFVPLSDKNPLTSIQFQFVTIALIAVNVAVFFLGEQAIGQAILGMALVPSELLREGVLGPVVQNETFDGLGLAERWTLLTYMFMHGDILHLAGNMLFLWVFGDNIEDAMGHGRFLIFYLLCGVFAGLAHVAMSTEPAFAGVPLIGASGAVAGCVAAYLMLHPKVQLWVLVFRFIPLQIAAFWALGAWIIMQFVMAVGTSTEPIAWWAHVGGLIAGALLIVVMKRANVPLFDRGLTVAD